MCFWEVGVERRVTIYLSSLLSYAASDEVPLLVLSLLFKWLRFNVLFELIMLLLLILMLLLLLLLLLIWTKFVVVMILTGLSLLVAILWFMVSTPTPAAATVLLLVMLTLLLLLWMGVVPFPLLFDERFPAEYV